MAQQEPDLDDPPEGLGAVVHGPVVLARAPGIGVGLRCVFGYPSGLTLLVVLRARGLPAQAAWQQSSFGVSRWRGGPESSSRLLLSTVVEGRRHRLDPLEEETSSGTGQFDQESTYWISPLPPAEELVLAVGWPQVGLPEQTSRVPLTSLQDLQDRVLPLP